MTSNNGREQIKRAGHKVRGKNWEAKAPRSTGWEWQKEKNRPTTPKTIAQNQGRRSPIKLKGKAEKVEGREGKRKKAGKKKSGGLRKSGEEGGKREKKGDGGGKKGLNSSTPHRKSSNEGKKEEKREKK